MPPPLEAHVVPDWISKTGYTPTRVSAERKTLRRGGVFTPCEPSTRSPARCDRGRNPRKFCAQIPSPRPRCYHRAVAQSTPKPVLLNTADADSLLSHVHGLDGPGIGHTAHTRLRYLQKIGFPHPKAGRGKRALHDLEALLKLALMFEMLDLGIEPSRGAATITAKWPDLRNAFADGWRALEHGRSDGQEGGAAKPAIATDRGTAAETDRKLIVLSPSALTTSNTDPLTIVTAGSIAGRGDGDGSARSRRARAIIDQYAIVSDIDAALEDVLRYRREEIVAAFEQLPSK